jgi:transposase-like protein
VPTHPRHASRRRHPAELKDKVLAACEEPGASVAAVAQAHGLNANLVHKWRRGQDVGRLSSTAGVTPAKVADLCQGQPNFPQCGNSNFPTRLRTVVVV